MAIAAAVLIGDVLRPSVESIDVMGALAPTEPGVAVRVALKGMGQSLEEVPTIQPSRFDANSIVLSSEVNADMVGEYCIEELAVSDLDSLLRPLFLNRGSKVPNSLARIEGFAEGLAEGISIIGVRYPMHVCRTLYESGYWQTYGWTDPSQANNTPLLISWRSDYGAARFPFDEWQGDVALGILAVRPDGGVYRAAPALYITSTATTWDVTARAEVLKPKDSTGDTTHLSLTIRRPLSIRLFTVFLLVAVFCLVVAIYFIVDRNTVVGVIIGVIFGLWSIHELLVPPGMPAVNLVRSVILFLYVVLVVVAFLRFFVKPLLEGPDEATMPPKASADDNRTDGTEQP